MLETLLTLQLGRAEFERREKFALRADQRLAVEDRDAHGDLVQRQIIQMERRAKGERIFLHGQKLRFLFGKSFAVHRRADLDLNRVRSMVRVFDQRFDQRLNGGDLDHADVKQTAIVFVDQRNQGARFVLCRILKKRTTDRRTSNARNVDLRSGDHFDAIFDDRKRFDVFLTVLQPVVVMMWRPKGQILKLIQNENRLGQFQPFLVLLLPVELDFQITFVERVLIHVELEDFVHRIFLREVLFAFAFAVVREQTDFADQRGKTPFDHRLHRLELDQLEEKLTMIDRIENFVNPLDPKVSGERIFEGRRRWGGKKLLVGVGRHLQRALVRTDRFQLARRGGRRGRTALNLLEFRFDRIERKRGRGGVTRIRTGVRRIRR